jgi:hypothetical protein
MANLKNAAALSAATQTKSYVTRQGPLVVADLQRALDAYGTLAQQYIQLLDFTSQMAGPSLTPVGSAPAAPAAIVTCNVTHNSLTASDLVNAPSASSMVMHSTRAGSTPSVFLDRAVSNPTTLLTTGNVPAFNLNGVAIPTTAYLSASGLFANVLAARLEIRAGIGEDPVITTWGAFITNMALPILNCYQTQLQLMFNRLKATAIPASFGNTVWLALAGVTPDSTQTMLDQLKVLRDPAGNPLYLPPAQSNGNRDLILAAVVNVNLSFAEAVEFSV